MEDINACTARKLTTFLGIPPRIANEVVKYRRKRKCISHMDELWRIKGMTRPLFRIMTHNLFVKNEHELKVGAPLPFAHTQSTVSRPIPALHLYTDINNIRNTYQSISEKTNPPYKDNVQTLSRADSDTLVKMFEKRIVSECPLDLTKPKRSHDSESIPHSKHDANVATNNTEEVSQKPETENLQFNVGRYHTHESGAKPMSIQSNFLGNLDLALNPIMIGKTPSGEGIVITYKSRKLTQRCKSATPAPIEYRCLDSTASKTPRTGGSHATREDTHRLDVGRLNKPSRSNDDSMDAKVSHSANGQIVGTHANDQFNSTFAYPPGTNGSRSNRSSENMLTHNNMNHFENPPNEKQRLIEEWLEKVPAQHEVNEKGNDKTLAVYRHISRRAKSGDSIAISRNASPQYPKTQKSISGLEVEKQTGLRERSKPKTAQLAAPNAQEYEQLYKNFERRSRKSKPRTIINRDNKYTASHVRKRGKAPSKSKDRVGRQRKSSCLRDKPVKRKTTAQGRIETRSPQRNEQTYTKSTQVMQDSQNQIYVPDSHEQAVLKKPKHRKHSKKSQATGSKKRIGSHEKHKGRDEEDHKSSPNEQSKKSAVDCSIL